MATVQLGISDGRLLGYDEAAFEFSLDGKPASFGEVRALDFGGRIHWRALEQRDWFHHIDEQLLQRCQAEARGGIDLDALSPEQRVLADAQRDDGVLAGKLVEADPALVQAVADELAKRAKADGGAVDQQLQADVQQNPLARLDLPRGMEALSQMERARGKDRVMTRAERRLMKRILRNDDKAKAKRERRQASGRGQDGPSGDEVTSNPKAGRLE